MTRQLTMKSTCLLILASVVVCNLIVCGGQGIPDEDELDRMAIDDIILQRAEGLLLQSILRKMQSEDGRSGVYIQFPIFCFSTLQLSLILHFGYSLKRQDSY